MNTDSKTIYKVAEVTV